MQVSFAGHVRLLGAFLDNRQAIVEAIEQRLLNVQGKDASRSRDKRFFDQRLNACFFELPAVPRDLARLKGELAERHLADGFEPVPFDQYSHELDPLELIVRAYDYWERHRWPGRSGRLTFAQSIYSVFMIRQLESLSLTIWDEPGDEAGARLQELQRLLDAVNASAVPGAFVRDARWLIHTAQGPLTRHLEPYFRIADQMSRSFTAPIRLALNKAGARLAGGHLRSQLRYRVWNSHRPMDDPEILAYTRMSNSMDTALLIRDLVPLLDAYAEASARKSDERLELADAILQGLSSDPELCLTRLDLLGPCTMIEELFVERDADGSVRYSARGRAHVARLACYGELIGSLAECLLEDAKAFDPARHVYSPYGIVYGFCADILSNMAAGTLLNQPSLDLSLEDVFAGQGRLDQKLARSKGWERLPTREGERAHFEHSLEWASQVFERLTAALEQRARCKTVDNASGRPDARLFFGSESEATETPPNDVPSAQEYCFVSDLKYATDTTATAWPKHHMLNDRREGRFLASVESNGRWFGISKMILTLFTSQGRDARITHVPADAIEILRVTCPKLIAPIGTGGTERANASEPAERSGEVGSPRATPSGSPQGRSPSD